MDAKEYVDLQAQIDRQTPEQQTYYDLAAGYTAQATAMQPEIDTAQLVVDEAQLAVDEAQAALDAATAAGEDPAPYEAALAVAKEDLDSAQKVLSPLLAEQAGYTGQAHDATMRGNGIGMMIAECQALIAADPTPPTPAQQAAARAEWLAYLLFLRREAVANAVQQVPVLVADLPIALGHAGLRAFVLDATKDKFGDVVVGGGPNKVPVYSDGLVWRIG